MPDQDKASLEDMFRPIVGARAFAEVVDQLTYAVQTGRLAVGDRLPTVEELSHLLGVSKPTVGEALRVLSDSGVLKVRRGATGGIEVASDRVPAEALRLSTQRRARRFGELVEARRAIEHELARLAGERARDDELDSMERHVQDLIEAEVGSAAWDQANSAFHFAMARLARSELLAYYQHQVLEEMATFMGAFPPRYSDPASSIAAHRETLDALRTRDPKLIALAMEHHFAPIEAVAAMLDEPDEAAPAI